MANLSNINNKFLVQTGGNVGIGTTSPTQLLHVNSSTNNPTGIGLQNSERYYAVRSNNYSLVFSDETVGSERMRIDSAGNVGIGITPTAKLEVQDANGISLKFGDLASYPNNVVPCFIGTGTSALAGINGDLVLVPRTSDAAKIIFATGNGGAATEKVRIANDGNVGIGSSNADAKLKVELNPSGTVLAGLRIGYNSTSTNYFDGDTQYFRNGAGTSTAMRIDSSGNLGIGVAPSSKLDVYQSTVGIGAADFRHVNGNRILVNPSYNYYDAYNHIFRGLSGTTTHMTIDVNGNVGIGNTSPTAKLTIDNSIATTYSTTGYAATPSNSMLYLNNTNGGSDTASLINFRTGSGDGLVGFVEGGGTNDADFIIQTDGGSNGIERFRITNAGDVGIGLTTPTGNLSMNSQIYLGTTPPSTYATNTSATRYQSFFNSGYGVTSDGVGPYPRYFDMVATGSPDGFNGGSNLRFFTTGIVAATGAELRMTINSAGKVGIGIAAPTQKLDVNGIVKHLGLDMSAGIQVDQTTAYTKTLTGTSGTWRPTGIDGTDLASTGSYLVQVYSNDHSGVGPANYTWYWTGTMSWYAGATNNNVTSEIYLNGCGHHTNLTFELRTKVNYNSAAIPYPELEWKSNTSFVDSPNWLFTFRRLL